MLRRIAVWNCRRSRCRRPPLFAQAAPAHAPAPPRRLRRTARVFASDAGMVLNFIKPDKTADFEAVMGKLKEALQKSDKPERKQQAASWKVFKSPDPAAGGNVLYVFVIDPVGEGRRLHGVEHPRRSVPAAKCRRSTSSTPRRTPGQNIVNLTLVADLGK